MFNEVMLHCTGMVTQYGKSQLGYGCVLCKCAHSSSINYSGLIFMYHDLGWLLHHLQSIYIVSGVSNSPDLALTCSNGLVGCP